MTYFRSHILVCNDPVCQKKGSMDIMQAIKTELESKGLDNEVQVLDTPRIGNCENGPEILVYPEGFHYINLKEDQIPFLIEEQFIKGRPVNDYIGSRPRKSKSQELNEPHTERSPCCICAIAGKFDPERY